MSRSDEDHLGMLILGDLLAWLSCKCVIWLVVLGELARNVSMMQRIPLYPDGVLQHSSWSRGR